jgi:linoleate 10R-lipoxygenase
MCLAPQPRHSDLSPLYGGGPSIFHKPVEDVRCLDGSGKIWPDVFGDRRLLFMPPSTGAVLVLFNRAWLFKLLYLRGC